MLDACDRQGMLMMDEYVDVWYIHKTKYDYAGYLNEWWQQDLKDMVEKFGADAIAAGVDAKDGMVAIQGWEQVSTVTATDLCLKMKEYGVKHIIYTDISRDGMLSGPNIPATKKLTEETGLDIIASGGVSCMEDLQALYDAGISGAIIGKALYENRVDLEEAVCRFEK